jgi:hypothetical protein
MEVEERLANAEVPSFEQQVVPMALEISESIKSSVTMMRICVLSHPSN